MNAKNEMNEINEMNEMNEISEVKWSGVEWNGMNELMSEVK